MSTDNKARKPSEVEVVEMVAVTLFYQNHRVPWEKDIGSTDNWTENQELRERYRTMARGLIKALDAAGMRVGVTNSRQMLKSLDDARTVPARVAYDLAEVK